jgi:hypothetical protein
MKWWRVYFAGENDRSESVCAISVEQAENEDQVLAEATLMAWREYLVVVKIEEIQP